MPQALPWEQSWTESWPDHIMLPSSRLCVELRDAWAEGCRGLGELLEDSLRGLLGVWE